MAGRIELRRPDLEEVKAHRAIAPFDSCLEGDGA